MILLIEYFTSSNKNRDLEYVTCIKENLKCEHIEKIVIFISDEQSKLEIESEKIEIIKLKERPSFNFLFEWCNNNFKDRTCIVSNTDIIFDNTISLVKEIDLENQFLALTRWDLVAQENKWYLRFFNHQWRDNLTMGMLSQDCWIFKTPIKIDDRGGFLMGKPGCDNRIVQIYHELGYKVKNPSMKIITKHLHVSNYRTYSHKDMVLGPYLLVAPTDNLEIEGWKQTIPHF